MHRANSLIWHLVTIFVTQALASSYGEVEKRNSPIAKARLQIFKSIRENSTFSPASVAQSINHVLPSEVLMELSSLLTRNPDKCNLLAALLKCDCFPPQILTNVLKASESIVGRRLKNSVAFTNFFNTRYLSCEVEGMFISYMEHNTWRDEIEFFKNVFLILHPMEEVQILSYSLLERAQVSYPQLEGSINNLMKLNVDGLNNLYSLIYEEGSSMELKIVLNNPDLFNDLVDFARIPITFDTFKRSVALREMFYKHLSMAIAEFRGEKDEFKRVLGSKLVPVEILVQALEKLNYPKSNHDIDDFESLVFFRMKGQNEVVLWHIYKPDLTFEEAQIILEEDLCKDSFTYRDCLLKLSGTPSLQDDIMEIDEGSETKSITLFNETWYQLTDSSIKVDDSQMKNLIEDNTEITKDSLELSLMLQSSEADDETLKNENTEHKCTIL